ncbi:MAG: FeoA family protein [Pirellulaceae bacterium]|jgi:Fe2+ transport system protein FeoA|nr:FeoA family protein [Pirellulaceae bacterium]MDP7017219.1 FeoA family protein [Pirellulaceae bacterium]
MWNANQLPTDGATNLASVSLEEELVVERVAAEGTDGIRLKRMGVCEGRLIQLVQAGDPLIISVAGSYVGVSRMLARSILVRPEMIETTDECA